MKRFRFLVCLFLVFWLAACQTSTLVPTTAYTQTVTVSSTYQLTATPTIAATSTFPPTATEMETVFPTETTVITVTPLPTPSKKILFWYSAVGDHSDFDMYLYAEPWPILVIYTDGQILMSGNPVQGKMMSKKELELFLEKLDKLGFYTIESNQKHDPSDNLYTMTDKDYERIYDASTYCIAVYAQKTRKLCYYSPFERFLVPQMQDVLAFLDSYDLPEMSPYSPERILISVHAGRWADDATIQNISWNEPSASLAELVSKNYGVNFIGGNLAKKLYGQYGRNKHIFIENGQEYTVYILAVWPHQTLMSPTN